MFGRARGSSVVIVIVIGHSTRSRAADCDRKTTSSFSRSRQLCFGYKNADVYVFPQPFAHSNTFLGFLGASQPPEWASRNCSGKGYLFINKYTFPLQFFAFILSAGCPTTGPADDCCDDNGDDDDDGDGFIRKLCHAIRQHT